MSAPTLSPIQGVSYSPAPSDDMPAPPPKYFDTDFANSTFPLLWGSGGGGRGDISALASIGVNFVHLYDWSVPPAPGNPPGAYERAHLPFLAECASSGVQVMVPVSNYFIQQIHDGKGATVKGQILAMVTEVYNGGATPVAGAGLWGVANEYDLAGALFDVNDVVQAIVYITEAEQQLGISAENVLQVTSPVSFATGGLPNAPGVAAIQALQTAIEGNASLGTAFWNARFVGSTNPFNDGAFLTSYIDSTFPQYFPDLPFFFAEMGMNIGGLAPTPEAQAKFVAGQLAATTPRGNFLGRCVFQFLDQSAMKSGTEATFGMTKYAGSTITTGTIPAGYTPGGGETYPVDELEHKPLWQSVHAAYQ